MKRGCHGLFSLADRGQSHAGGAGAFLLVEIAGAACPFCTAEGTSLVGDYRNADMVLYGYFTNAKMVADGVGGGTSDFVIEKVLKSHDIVKAKKVISVPVFMPPGKSKWIIFCSVFKENINPFPSVEVTPGSEVLKYLEKALEFQDAQPGARLRYCFDFLNSADQAVATDAYREFAIADYSDYKSMAKTLPARTLAEWLEDPKTPSFRLGLYASLLGHCGDAKIHGALLRSMLDDNKRLLGANLDGIMAGYCMLQPKEGYAYLQKLLKDGDQDFALRFAGMRTLRFMWDYRSDVLNKKQVVEGMSLALDAYDVSDFAIEDLRSWKAWEMSDKVLDLFGKKSHDNPIVKRAILRFALCSPSPRAAEFVKEQRKRDETWVNDTEELLRIDTPAPKLGPELKKSPR